MIIQIISFVLIMTPLKQDLQLLISNILYWFYQTKILRMGISLKFKKECLNIVEIK